MTSHRTNTDASTTSSRISTPSSTSKSNQPGIQTPQTTDTQTNTRRYSQINQYYSPEGNKSNTTNGYLSNDQLYGNTSTENLYNQLKTHTELASRAATELLDRRKEELANFKQEYNKKIEEQKSLFDKKLTKQI